MCATHFVNVALPACNYSMLSHPPLTALRAAGASASRLWCLRHTERSRAGERRTFFADGRCIAHKVSWASLGHTMPLVPRCGSEEPMID